MHYKQTCVYGVIAGRRVRGIELYTVGNKPTSGAIELKGNFTLNHA